MGRTLACNSWQERQDAIVAAVRAAKNGRLVALPAETGYVLAVDAFSATGVAALQRAKGLSATTSLGVLIGHPGAVHGISGRVPPIALDLMAAFWPGQLALVLPTQPTLHWTVPTDRCAVRMPLHPVLLSVVAEVGPMVHSGASESDLALADLLLDAGPRPPGPGSTVIDATTVPPRLMRAGAFTEERIRAVAPGVVVA